MTSDRELIDAAAKGLPLEPEPWRDLARELSMSQEEIIERIGRLIEEGKVRRFAASVRHQPVGYSYNAMVVARTDEENLDRVGESAAAIEAVSHCYHRHHPDGDPWCVYVMVHGREKEIIDRAVEDIKSIPGVRETEVCHSTGELKKTSVSGITTEIDNLD